MAIVSISEAARLTGKDRKTLRRHLEAGRLSASTLPSGEKGVDTSELIRVYGEFPSVAPGPSQGKSGTFPQHSPGEKLSHSPDWERLVKAKDDHIATLQRQLEELKAEKAELKAQVTVLLPPPAPVAKKRRWWSGK